MFSFTDRSKAVLLFGSFLLFMFDGCLYYTVLSDPCSFVATRWERADLLIHLCVMIPCVCHFPILWPGSGVVLECIDS